MNRPRSFTAALLATALAWQPFAALAQSPAEGGSDSEQQGQSDQKPTANAEAEAKAAFARAEDAFKLGRYADSIANFEDAYRLSHKIEILFNIGLANRKAFEVEKKPEYLRRALQIYQQFMRLTVDDAEKRAARQAIGEVSDEIATLEEQEGNERNKRLLAGEGPKALQAVVQLYADGKAAEAMKQIDALLHSKTGNSTVVLLDLYRLEGEIGIEAGQPAQSLDAYKHLLALAPNFDLPRTVVPAARASLAKAREFWATQGTFSVSPGVPPPAIPDQPLAIPVTVESDPLGMVFRITLKYRRAGDRRFSSVSRAGAGDITIPALALPSEDAGYRVEYYIIITDRYNNVLTTIGGETAPLSFPVLSPQEVAKLNEHTTPWYASWWLWTGVGVVVAGAVAAIVVVSTTNNPPCGTFSCTPLNLNAAAPQIRF